MLRWISLGLVSAFANAATLPFAAPEIGPVAFRRDRVPLDAARMAELSSALECLARGMALGEPVERRAVAQVLAISIALDPANSAARELVGEFERGGKVTAAEDADLAASRQKAWEMLGWLSSSEAGPHGKALADCLMDVMIFADPGNPKVAGLKGTGELGAWKGWVPETSAYVEPAGETPALEDPAVQPGEEGEGPALEKAAVVSPLRQTVAKQPATVPVSMEMTAEAAPGAEWNVVFSTTSDQPSLDKIGAGVAAVVARHHGKVPAATVKIGWGKTQGNWSESSASDASAAAAVLASAAVTGRVPEAAIIGMIDGKGAFLPSAGMWEKLRAMEKGAGGRLILPTAAAEFLPAILAMEKPDFFLRYEILFASNFQELLDRSAKELEGPVAEASAKFSQIAARVGTQPVPAYVANRFVRQRLVEISQSAPYHASARMLAMQAAGERPSRLPRKVLAWELSVAVEPVKWIAGLPLAEYGPETADRLDKTFDQTVPAVDRLERYVDINDRDLHAAAKSLTAAVRTLGRACRSRKIDVYTGVDADLQPAIRDYSTARGEFQFAAAEALGIAPEEE